MRDNKGQFVKGCPTWNKGIKGEDSHMFGRKHGLGSTAWNKGKKLNYAVWNKGKTGYTTSHKGFKHSEETKKKMSESRKRAMLEGTIKSWNKGMKGYRAGKESHLWRGGISKVNRTKRANDMSSLEYKDWRSDVFEKDDYTCRICGNRGVVLNAHHIISYNDFPNFRYDTNNGVVICEECHYSIRGKEFLYIPEFLNL